MASKLKGRVRVAYGCGLRDAEVIWPSRRETHPQTSKRMVKFASSRQRPQRPLRIAVSNCSNGLRALVEGRQRRKVAVSRARPRFSR